MDNYPHWFIMEVLQELEKTNNDFILISKRLMISIVDLKTMFFNQDILRKPQT
jgi:hypothetical protein